MQLTVKDFQGWKDATLSMEGLTVVVGPSSRGKSALSRALKGILRNTVSEGQIRLGSKETRVSLSLSDHEIECSRALKGSASYVVDGAEFAKLGGEVPPPMLDWGHQPVEVNGVKVDPIFAGQFDAQFLLSSSPAETSAILNAFASTERLDKGKKVLKGYVAEVDSEAKVLGAQVSALQEQVNEVTRKADQCEGLRATLAEQMTRTRTLNLVTRALGSLLETVTTRAAIDAKLKVLATVDMALTPVTAAHRRADAHTRLLGAAGRLGGVRERIHALEGVDPFVDVAMKAFLRLDRTLRIHGGEVKRTLLLRRRESVDRVADAETKTLKTYSALVRLRALLVGDPTPLRTRASALQGVATQVQPTEELLRKATATLRSVQAVAAAAEARRKLSLAQDEIADVTAEVQQAEAEIVSWRRANHLVTCPKCAHEFTPTEDHHA